MTRLKKSGSSIDAALSKVVGNVGTDPNARGRAARLLRDIGHDDAAYVALLTEYIGAGDKKLPELCRVILSMGYGFGRLTRPEFDILRETLRTGTPEQRYWVVNHIAFFDRRQVRNALIEVLEDRTAPEYVRGWAAERLHLHISRSTVEACVRAVEDTSAEVRLWAVYTLGEAASASASFRNQVLPVLERMLTDFEVAPGWWSVRREAQSYVARLCGEPSAGRRLQAEIQAILQDPNASVEDRHWAGFNDES